MEKISLRWTGSDRFEPVGRPVCIDFDPNILLLYSAGLSAGRTAVSMFREMNVSILSFTVEITGNLTETTAVPYGSFTGFKQVFNIACPYLDEQERLFDALDLSRNKYCSFTKILKKIGPVKQEVYVNDRKVE